MVTTHILGLKEVDSHCLNSDAIDTGGVNTIESGTEEILLKGNGVLWSPKSTNKLAARETFLRPAEKIRLERAGMVQDEGIGTGDDLLPSIHKHHQNRSVYT